MTQDFVTQNNDPEGESRALFRDLHDFAPDALITVDSTGTIVLVNAQAERLFGYERDELVGAPVEILLPMSARTRHVKHRAVFLEDPKARPMGAGRNLRARTKGGGEIPVDVSLSPLRTAHGTLVTAAVRDVSERVNTELRLSTYRDIFDRSPLGYLTLRLAQPDDPMSFTLSGLNPAAARLLGIPEVADVGSAITMLFPETASPQLLADLLAVIRHCEARDFGEVELRDGPLKGHIFQVAVFPLPDSSAGICFEDITERKSIAEQLRRRTEEAEALNRDLESFSYSVSHDLRAPLRSIDGFSQALLDDCGELLGDAGRHHLERVRVNAQRMSQLIDDIFYLSKVSRANLSPSRVDLSSLAHEIGSQLARNTPDRVVKISIEEGMYAVGDARLLRIALENLLSNAWKFTAKSEGARIEFFSTEIQGAGRIYSIRDNGSGFDPAYAHKLFGVFQRLHSSSEFPGTGVGLATVQRVIHKHGGKVFAEGCQGLGATFSFTLRTAI